MPIEDTADFNAKTTKDAESSFDAHVDADLEFTNFASASRRLHQSNGGDIFHNETLTKTGTNVITPSAELQRLHEKKFVPNKKRIVGTGAVLAVGLALTPTVVDHLSGPEFSEETKTVVVEDGDGTQSLLEKANIPGYDSADWRDVSHHVQELPENKDVYKDGLQAGETVSVPVSIDGK